jgi:hypothetical protein
MTANQIIQQLELVKLKHKDRRVGVGELNLYNMCDDCARKLKETTEFKLESSDNTDMTLECKNGIYVVYDKEGAVVAEFLAYH